MKKIFIILLAFSFFQCKTEKKENALPNSIEALTKQKKTIEKTKDSLDHILTSIETKLEALDTVKKFQKVTVLNVKPTVFEHYISIQGNTKTDKNIIVRPLTSGIITNVFINEGQHVSKGQTLMQLDDAVLRNSISEIENQLSLATTTYERQKRLWEQKIGSEMQYLQVKNQKEALEKRILTLKSQLKNYKIKAPFTGIVDDVIANLGDLASPQTPTLRLINLNKMYIESDVSENYLKDIKKGNKAIVSFPSIAFLTETKITKVGNFINPDNRSFKVKINLKNNKRNIKPNLLADIKINDYTAKNAISIPSNLVQTDENGNTFVFTVTTKENRQIVTKNMVETGKEYNGKTEILKGLTEKDLIIYEGSRNVSEGQEVISDK